MFFQPRIDVMELMNRLKALESWDRLIDSIACQYNLFIDYIDMVYNLEAVCEFLGVGVSKAIYMKPKTDKQNSTDLSVLVQNYDDLCMVHSGTIYERFLQDVG